MKKHIRFGKHIFKAILILLSINSCSGPQKPGSLFDLADTTQIKTENSLQYSFTTNGELLIQSSGASKQTPAIYFGKVKVTPGKTYTYFVRGRDDTHNGIQLYVTSKGENIVWPGGKMQSGVAKSVFKARFELTEVTLALVFLYPVANDHLLISDIAFFEGDLDPAKWPPPVEKKYSKFASK